MPGVHGARGVHDERARARTRTASQPRQSRMREDGVFLSCFERSPVRFRPIASLSVVAAAALLLAGCSVPPTRRRRRRERARPTRDSARARSPTPRPPTVSSCRETSSRRSASPSRRVQPHRPAAHDPRRGQGPAGEGRDVLKANFTLIDTASGAVQLQTLDTEPNGMDTLISSQQIFGAALECAPLGSRTVSSFPAGTLGEGSPAFVLVADSISELPTRAEGTRSPPVDGMPRGDVRRQQRPHHHDERRRQADAAPPTAPGAHRGPHREPAPGRGRRSSTRAIR